MGRTGTLLALLAMAIALVAVCGVGLAGYGMWKLARAVFR